MATWEATATETDNDNNDNNDDNDVLGAAGSTSLAAAMTDAFAQLEHPALREVLLHSLVAEQASLDAIQASFAHFTERAQDLDVRRTFFASWQRTNNSAMSVEGLANRLTDAAEGAVGRLDSGQVTDLFRAAGRLNRVTDEDLGVRGQVLHFELYYRMATELTDGDGWQSRRYCLSEASSFKSWLDAARLREPIMTGLYSMLIHEGYTHAELEMIAPLFLRWTTETLGLPRRQARLLLAWIAVHNGGTEKRHFAHSCAALGHYCAATGSDVDLQAAGEMFRTYLRRKAAVMSSLDMVY
jgi:hypothetical protein